MPIALLALLSGIPALMVQVVWTREVTLLAGGQLDAIATVVAAFFGGLALGARALGGVADRTPRPLRLYAQLEIASAVLGLGTLWGLRALESSTSLGSSGMLIASAALLIPPTVALGGTQPALLRSTGTAGARATRPAGQIQGSNTLGAVIGVALAVVTIPTFGLWATACAAALLAASVGCTALLIDRGREPLHGAGEPTGPRPPLPTALLLLAACAGFATLGFEVLAARMATIRLGSSLYAWGLVLALFLGGLGVGNLAFERAAARARHPGVLLGVIETACACVIALGLPFLHPPLGRAADGVALGAISAIALGILPAAILMGGAFPVFARLLLDTCPGRSFGALSAWNTAGGIAGSLLTPLLLIPSLGLMGAALGCAAVVFAVGAAAFAGARRPDHLHRGAMTTAGACFAAAAVLGGVGVRAAQPGGVVFAAHGRSGSAVVIASGAQRSLIVDGDPEASTVGNARRTEELLAALPLAVHPNPTSFLEVGLGSGITLGTAARFALDTIDCVEIAESVVAASRFFRPDNRGVLEDPRVDLIRRDALVFFRQAEDQYDVIAANTLHPWSVGATGLYSTEYYERLAQALAPGGITAQWLPVGRMAPEHFSAIVRTFFETFRSGGVFWLEGNVILLGSKREFALPGSGDLRRRLARAGLDPATYGLASNGALGRRRVATAETVRARIAAEPLLRNDRPLLERRAHLRNSRHSEAAVLDRLATLARRDHEGTGGSGAIELWLEGLAARRRGDTKLANGREELAFRAGLVSVPQLRAERLAMEGHRALAREEPTLAEGLYESALQSNPTSAEAELGLAAIALARGDRKHAVRRLQQVVALQPHHPAGWQLLATALHELGRTDEARDAIDRALTSNPVFPDGLATAGLIAVQQGEPEEVERLLLELSSLGANEHYRALQEVARQRWSRFRH